MMIMLRDDPVIELFESAEKPPDGIEGIDIENGEFQFCDDRGQRYVGEITRPSGFFRQAQWRLKPEGSPNIQNALDLIDKAKIIEPNAWFPDLKSLRKHTTTAPMVASQSSAP
jgi:hypothetical protein